MNPTLAVFTAQFGTVSETFVRRHVEDLLPKHTVAVAQRLSHPLGGRWHPPCPALFLDRWQNQIFVRLVRYGGISYPFLRAHAVERFLRKRRVTVVLGEYLDEFVEFVPLLNRMGLHYVVQGHGIDLSAALRDRRTQERYRAYTSAQAILTRCEFHRQRLIELGLPAERIHVNPGGVDIPKQLPVRQPGAAKRFLAIGRMVPKKGPILLLEAFRRVAVQDHEVTLDYIGSGELFAAAQQFVRATNLQGRLRLHGMASEGDKHVLLQECGVFLQHSITDPDTGDEEGLPAAIQEAMANGLAVVSTRHAGISEAVDEGVTGRLVSEGDVAGMAEAMLRLARGEDRFELFGAAGHSKAALLYSWPAERARLLTHLGVADSAGVTLTRRL